MPTEGDASGELVPAATSGVVNVGVDLCDVDRLRTAMQRTPRFRDRVFTPGEQSYCERRRDPGERYAARFAAKEAVLKALGVGLGACSLREIEVIHQPSGAPRLELHGAAAKLAAERGITSWRISLTHTASMAQAVVVALTGEPS